MEAPRGLAWLEVIEGSDVGSRFEIGSKPVLIGRGSRCEIRVQDPKASREHTRLIYEDGRLMAVDLDSSNGLRVNDVLTKQTALQDGDRIKIGDTLFGVHLSQDAVATVLDQDPNHPTLRETADAVKPQVMPGVTHCTECGRAYGAGEIFCGSCGTKRKL